MASTMSRLPESESPSQTDTPMTDANGYSSTRALEERGDQINMIYVFAFLASLDNARLAVYLIISQGDR